MDQDVIDKLLKFLDTMLDKDPVTQQKVMKLFKKHFYNFKDDLKKLMDGEDESVRDNENDKDEPKNGNDEQSSAGTDQELADVMKSTLDVLESLDFALKDFKKAAILKAIFDKPLALRNDL